MNISMFDILGPIMIGPSSSHTAGAQRIGKAMYNMISDKQLVAVHFILHGSFHLTLRGHGTDRALVGGVLGMNAYDPQIIEAWRAHGAEIALVLRLWQEYELPAAAIKAQVSSRFLDKFIGSNDYWTLYRKYY